MEGNLVENWRSFKQKWKNCAIVTNLTQQYQVTLLLHIMGDSALETYKGFHITDGDNNRKVIPTSRVSHIVLTQKKNADLIYPRELNQALKHEHFIYSILEDMLHELGQSSFFSKVSSGFWHVVRDHELSFLTTFQTCSGLYRLLRLPFGPLCHPRS